jgi:hypothetical protein
VALTVTNDSSRHYVTIKQGVNNPSCGGTVQGVIWQYYSTITCGGTTSGDPSNMGQVQYLFQGSFVTVADDTWFVACVNGWGIPVPYSIVVSSTAEGGILGTTNIAFGEQNFGGTFS